MPNDVPDWTLSIQGAVAGEVEAADFKCDGLVGSQVSTRWVGAVNGAAPTQIDSIGDHAWDEQGGVWVQTGTTLATWVWVPSLSAAGDLVLPSAGRGSGNILATTLKGTADAATQLVADTITTGKQASLALRSAGTTKWSVYKQTDDSFIIQNAATLRSTVVGPSSDNWLFPQAIGVSGVAGAVAGTRWLGAVNGGPPTGVSGPVAGDYVTDFRWGIFWIWDGGRWLPSGGPGPYQARMYRNAGLSVNGTQVLPFDTIEYDPNGNASTGASASYTAPIAGRYRVVARTSQSNTASGVIRLILSILAGGSEVRRGLDNSLNNLIFGGHVEATVTLALAQNVQIQTITQPAGAVNLEAGSALTYFEVAWQGPA